MPFQENRITALSLEGTQKNPQFAIKKKNSKGIVNKKKKKKWQDLKPLIKTEEKS